MAYVTPDSEVRLISGYPCDNTYNHTLFFTDTTQQYNTISAMVRYTLNNRTYQRWNNKTIRVGMVADLLYDCNYMMFRNTHYSSDRWFYAFINRVTYINDNCTEIEYEIDDMQSWLGKWSLLPSFVEREHAASDNIGENLVEENITQGDYMVASTEKFEFPGTTEDRQKIVILVAYSCAQGRDASSTTGLIYWNDSTNDWAIDSSTQPAGTSHGNVISGVSYVPITFVRGNLTSIQGAMTRLSKLVTFITSSTSGISIVGMWEMPYVTRQAGIGPEYTTEYHWDLSRPNAFPGVGSDASYPLSSVRNNKLLTYPYCALSISNNDGNAEEYHWEYFNPGTSTYDARFYVESILQPAPTLSLIPTNYKNNPVYYEAGLELQKFVDMCWSEDSYSRWWAQNQSTYSMGIVSGILGMTFGGLSIASGSLLGGANAMSNAALAIGQQNASKTDAKAMPDNVRGSVVGTGSKLVQDRQTFTAYSFMITAERARMIDDYFSMYGYKTNKVKVPNVDVRERWCYTKTNGCKIHATTSAEVEKHIENIFDHGITFWRDYEHVGNYSYSNEVR